MPHRLLPYFPYPRTFLLGLFSGGSSLLAAALDDRAVAIAMAVVAMGAVLAQPLMRAYDAYRERKRANDKADRAEQTGEFEVEVRKRVELEEQVKRLQAELEEFRRRAKAAVREVNSKADAALGRLDAVEAQQGSTSGLDIPAQPQEPRS